MSETKASKFRPTPNADVSATKYYWNVRSTPQKDTPDETIPTPASDLHPSAVRILERRGIPVEKQAEFLAPTRENSMLPPTGLRRMNKAVKFIHAAMQRGEKIAVLGDYDVDGCSGTALLERFFREVGYPADQFITYIPHRVNEGYGPNVNAVRKLAAEGVKMLITVDCGTTSYESLQLAKELGMKVIVTDHHKPDQGTKYPDGAEIVNPNRKDNKTPVETARKYQVLTGAGVAYLLSEALYDRLEKPEKNDKAWFETHPKPDRKTLFDKLVVLAALGTHCDVAPITGMNRWLVAESLNQINDWQQQTQAGTMTTWPLPGLQQLVEVSGLRNKKITSDHFGFQIGPRLNAAGRLDHGKYAKNLLATDDVEQAKTLAVKCQKLNDLRKSTQDKIFDEARRQAEAQVAQGKSIIVVSQKGWDEGVIGIVAGKLKEIFDLPACVIAIDEAGNAKGSARSIEGVDLGDAVISALHSEPPLLSKGGGHMMAAGFSLPADRLPALHEFLNNQLAASVEKATATKQMAMDDVITVGDITPELAHSYQKLGPFGRHNEPPRVVIRDASIVEGRVVGRKSDTLQLHVRDKEHNEQRAQAVLFQKASHPLGIRLRSAQSTDTVQLAGSVTAGEFQGRPQIQVEIKDAYIGELNKILPDPATVTYKNRVTAPRTEAKRILG
ncbi:MAG: single-stranded-DNA-specific exonuclease RecJ [Rickettsiales bacterium]|nr:single-stranded-DNA-specific exonuclease RecJ [Rickettsiales bacterium]